MSIHWDPNVWVKHCYWFRSNPVVFIKKLYIEILISPFGLLTPLYIYCYSLILGWKAFFSIIISVLSPQSPSCCRSWRKWMIKLCWWKSSSWRVKPTMLSVTFPKPGLPSPQPGPPPMPFTVPQSSRQLLICSQASLTSLF